MWQKRLDEIQARKLEIRSLLESEGECDIDGLTTELRSLDGEQQNIMKRVAALRGLQAMNGQDGGEVGGQPDPILAGMQGRSEGMLPGLGGEPWNELVSNGGDTIEERAQHFAKHDRATVACGRLKRALTLASGSIAQPTRVSGLQLLGNDVSGIIDMVQVVDATGMGTDRVAYQKTEATANVKADGTATPDTDSTFDIAEIKPVLVSTLTYISKNIQHTTPVNYQARTVEVSMRALRRKIAKMIVSGNPTLTPAQITGIINAGAIDGASDKTLGPIGAGTLREIVLNYGGDDVLEGGCVLQLNKKDLIAFGDVRGTNEKKYVYEIEFANGSTTTGTIKDGGLAVTFVINSECKALSGSGTAAGDYTMLYGKPLSYQLDLFGNYEIEVSKDFKFDQGLLAVRGEVMVGGNVVAQNGWMRVKKA